MLISRLRSQRRVTKEGRDKGKAFFLYRGKGKRELREKGKWKKKDALLTEKKGGGRNLLFPPGKGDWPLGRKRFIIVLWTRRKKKVAGKG